jgi:hypothetical protein
VYCGFTALELTPFVMLSVPAASKGHLNSKLTHTFVTTRKASETSYLSTQTIKMPPKAAKGEYIETVRSSPSHLLPLTTPSAELRLAQAFAWLSETTYSMLAPGSNFTFSQENDSFFFQSNKLDTQS